MSLVSWLQCAVFAVLVTALVKPLGNYMFQVFEGQERPWQRLERWCFAICGVDPRREQTWDEYAAALLVFSALGMLVTYAILRLQGVLPLNPERLPGLEPALAFNTAASFVSNTNWQSYAGESTLSYFSQMAGLAWHNFTSAAAGMGVALALSRGLTRRQSTQGPATLGNFWVDLVRATLYVLLPVSLVMALLLASQGVVQNLSAYVHLTGLGGVSQVLPMGPVASQEAIKMLGTNGGGFFNANSAHPFENPTGLTNLIEMVLIFAIPAAMTYTYGRMAGNTRQGWVLFAAMAVLFIAGTVATSLAESQSNAAFAGLPVAASGNMEGKEVRFGVPGSALFATVTTAASCGAVNATHDSFTPLGGLVPLINIQLGEVIFGGVGAGLYGMLIFVILGVFIAGLMVGRTPEYLGKKIEAREMQLAMLYVLIFPLVILTFTGWSAVRSDALGSLANHGPHGLTEMLYASSSATGNNGSAFAGLNANTPWWNIGLGMAMLLGRFFMIVPVLAVGGSMVSKRIVPPSLGTFPTDTPLFAGLLVGVIILLGALTFFPALCLGPVVEHFVAAGGKLF